MALIANYEVPNTGMVIPNAYHVIAHVDVVKRLKPLPHGGDNRNDTLQGGVGYVGGIYLAIYASKQAREDGLNPVAYLSQANPDKPFPTQFVLDIESTDSYLTQSYNFLKSLEYYQGAIED